MILLGVFSRRLMQGKKPLDLDFFFFAFLGLHLWHMEVPRLGSNESCSCWPTAQPQQCQIRAASATYTAAHSIAGSLTH